jgi:FkbH-like protein
MTTDHGGDATRIEKPRQGRIKCVVWDLDNTLWEGTLLEGDDLVPRPEIVSFIRSLDQRGILHSVASRNDYEAAVEQLERFGLAEYFQCPQVSWNPKSDAIRAIAKAVNLGLDAFAFVDDQEFELAEVGHAHPEVMCVHVDEIVRRLDTPEFTPRFITDESRRRRWMYASTLRRDVAEREFTGANGEFLRTLDMVFTIAKASTADLQRAEELTVRTNQLNSTGRTYSYSELAALATSPDHLLLVANLVDRFGDYGTIGVGLVERGGQTWTIKLLLMSCRVMSRGVGTVLLNHITSLARQHGVRLQAEFVHSGRNRVMHVTYGFAGFREVGMAPQGGILLESDPAEVQEPPPHLAVIVK